MGWKNVKEHYKIEHIVTLEKGNICIGSAYCRNLINILPSGEVRWGMLGPSLNDDLERYFSEMTEDKDKLLELMNKPDTFKHSLPVYTYSGGEIIEKQCEEYDWPNCTHDGELMYENVFFKDKLDAVKEAIRNAEACLRMTRENIKRQEEDLQKTRKFYEQEINDLEKLKLELIKGKI
ncbi:MAG: hypothetical protein M0R32_09235 [Candidatus Cloacimonetes bacterium]|jgi:hypothetical protein|nr:hypothetical protein [Candidatus Cloacimonadota bacterium]